MQPALPHRERLWKSVNEKRLTGKLPFLCLIVDHLLCPEKAVTEVLKGRFEIQSTLSRG